LTKAIVCDTVLCHLIDDLYLYKESGFRIEKTKKTKDVIVVKKIIAEKATIIFILVIVLILVGLLCYLYQDKEKEILIPSIAIDEVEEGYQIDNHPFFSQPVKSWDDVLKHAKPEFWIAFSSLHNEGIEEVQKWAAEEAKGKSFLQTRPVGMIISNTGWEKGRVVIQTRYFIKKNDDKFLTAPDGLIRVKVSCGNPAKEPKPCPPPKREKEAINSTPKSTPFHKKNPSTQQPVPEVPPTPGYTPGNVEKVEEGRGVSTEEGKPTTGEPGTGTDSGTQTPTGSTVQPDGSTIIAPEPDLTEAPAPPPPKADVDGTVPEP
jgi:hypothetical protein